MTHPGMALRMIRESAGLSLRDVAEKAGTSASVVMRMEHDGVDNTTHGTVMKVCAVLGIAIDDLYNGNIDTCPQCKGRGWVKKEE